MIRTHTCNELNVEHIGQSVVLCGWVDTIRDHGGVIFVDLRDHYGITQTVLSDDSMLKNVTKETVISVKGVVSKRDEETVNAKLATGYVEVKVESLEILGPCRNALPFEISASTQTREDVRLKYRF
ncbi:MAG: Asp-tRNA(Asn)/Glu-tRNA(Gln) amidotransferase GatCAB subunit C, partial [Clostridia bacterium]|nr:Asp-tRNA(Asn)/Glu-tRNA(Gln) amidotransferase GatCAB subunit C [Clostridia bacterium]